MFKPLHQLFLSGIFILGLLPLAAAQEMIRFAFQHPQMGTTFRVILYAENESLANKSAEAVFARVDELNKCLSDYLPESELNRLSSTAGIGQWVAVSTDLWQVLSESKKISKATKGAFDVSVGPLSKLWRRAFRHREFPDVKDLSAATALVNYRNIRLRPGSRKVKLKKAGMRLDLGGIAKGFALDEAMKVLAKNGIEHALVDGGGDILVRAAPPGKKGWNIAFQKYSAENELVADSILLVNTAVATSGDHYRFLFWQGKRYSHIINPKTGLGTSEERLVTVIGPSGILTDALASAFSVLPKKRQKKVIRKFPEIQVQVFDKTVQSH